MYSSSIDSLYVKLSKAKEDTNKVNLLNQIAIQCIKEYPDSILFYSQKAIELSNKLNYTSGNILATGSLAIGYMIEGNMKKSIEINLNLVDQLKMVNNKSRLAKVYGNLGSAYSKIGNKDKAIDYINLSLQVKQELKDSIGMAFSYNVLGDIFSNNADFVNGYKYYLLSLKIAEKTKDSTLLTTGYAEISDIYYHQAKYEDAILYIKKAIDICFRIKNLGPIGDYYLNLGLAFQAIHKIDSSEACYNKSLDFAKINNRLESQASALALLSDIYTIKKLYDKAIKYALEAIEINKQTEISDELISSYQSLGNAYYGIHEYKKAIRAYEESINECLQSNHTSPLVDLYNNIAKAYEADLDFKNALYFKTKAYENRDSILSESKNNAIAQMQTKFETEKKDQEISLLKKDQEIKEEKTIRERYVFGSITVIAILISLSLFLLSRLRKREQNRRQIQLEKYKLQLEKQMIELEQKALQSQMNPHFIFNALNSIQSFITSKDVIQASLFLSKFAKLMRLILESSRSQLVFLEDEIKMLGYYLELQQLCYGKKFNFKIEVDETIDEEVKIPPMILQPYVENAIIHGVLNKENTGNITMRFSMKDNSVCVEIDDDGIGREKANVLKKESGGDFHKSVGLLITQERIEIFNKENNKHITTTIIDKKDSAGTPLGTQALISFPAIYN